MSGWVAELFASIQGEGPWMGRRQIFLRLAGCRRTCAFCDTAAARRPHPRLARLIVPEPAAAMLRVVNPVPASFWADRIADWAERFGPFHSLAVTGGEPLEQPEFCRDLAFELRRRIPRLPRMLETNGLEADAVRRVRGVFDFISADLKLPTASGLRGVWPAVRRFLSAVRGSQGCLKTVFTPRTPADEIRRAAAMACELAPEWEFILQPATPKAGRPSPAPETLQSRLRIALRANPRARLLPQIHPVLGMR